MTDISREAVERHLDISENHEAGLIPVSSQSLIRALRDALDEAHRAGWSDAIEAAVADMDMAAHIMSHHGSFAEERSYQNAAKSIRALPYKPQEDASDE